MAEHEIELIPLSDVPAVVASMTRRRKRPHKRTVQRWAYKGIAGRRLRVRDVGGTACTTREWLLEFFAERKAAPTPAKNPAPATRRPMTPRDHRREGLRSLQSLQAAGVL